MKTKIGNGLLALNLLSIALVVAINLFPSSSVRIVLGFPFILFCPGYALAAALYPRRAGIGGIERFALSFGLSIAVVALIGLILNYLPWGISLESMLYSIASFILIMSIVTWLRQRKLPEAERFGINFALALPSWGTGVRDKSLSIATVLAVVVALGVMSYVLFAPKVGQQFTEFYILGPDGGGGEYPIELVVGDEESVTVGIVNHEYETASYRIEVRIDGVTNNEVRGITLEHEEKWESKVSFTPNETGNGKVVEFLLFRDEGAEPYFEPLRLWMDVRSQRF